MNDTRLAELREKYKNRNLLEELACGIYADHSGYTTKQSGEFLNWLFNMAYRAVKGQQKAWIPVSERLPKELEPVNITWINHNPESYYADIKDKPFTATGVYFNGQWYWWSTLCTDILAEYSHNYDDIIDDDIEITAWMPLPESYKEESEVKE